MILCFFTPPSSNAMCPQLLQSCPSRFIMLSLILIIIIIFTDCCCAQSEQYKNCSRPYYCGAIQGITYPFWGDHRPDYCGHGPEFELKCRNNSYPIINIQNMEFRVLKIDSDKHTMTIAPNEYGTDKCSLVTNTSFDGSQFVYGFTNSNLDIYYNCTSNVREQAWYNITCSLNDTSRSFYYFGNKVRGCEYSVVAPILSTTYEQLSKMTLTLEEALVRGFEVIYNVERKICLACEESGGVCGTENSYEIIHNENAPFQDFICYCQDHPDFATCRGTGRKLLKLILGSSAAVGLLLMVCIIICCSRQKVRSRISVVLFKRNTKNDNKLESFIRHHKDLAPKRYSYSDIKKITNSFRDKLGQGGFGEVYKGKLFDNSLVAVKLLDSTKGDGEDFINEVGTISGTSHVNIVKFLGFCLQGSKRALIYEFMPNGSLEKYIHAENYMKNIGYLRWETMYQIASGIARGLEYLHRGCHTRILHFDIKPHNILLDEEFCPKIADFGLAKLYNKKQSVISMMGARGTIGYIAPELVYKNLGGVSHKSDVYSYGMMVLEMVGGRKNIDVAVDHISEIYFPHWIYSCLEQDKDIALHGDISKEQNEIARKIIVVGLWCIQSLPSQRPSMSKVIEMLESHVEGLEMPPQPYLSSLSRSLRDSDTPL